MKYKIYFNCPSNVELIDSKKTKKDALSLAKLPGIYYSQKLSNDMDSWITVTNSESGELLFQTETEREKLLKL